MFAAEEEEEYDEEGELVCGDGDSDAGDNSAAVGEGVGGAGGHDDTAEGSSELLPRAAGAAEDAETTDGARCRNRSSCNHGFPNLRQTRRPRWTAGRFSSMSAHRPACVYLCVKREPS